MAVWRQRSKATHSKGAADKRWRLHHGGHQVRRVAQELGHAVALRAPREHAQHKGAPPVVKQREGHAWPQQCRTQHHLVAAVSFAPQPAGRGCKEHVWLVGRVWEAH